MGNIEKFNGENIDRQHLRPPVLATLLETIERESFSLASNLLIYVNLSIFPPSKNVLYNIIKSTYIIIEEREYPALNISHTNTLCQVYP